MEKTEWVRTKYIYKNGQVLVPCSPRIGGGWDCQSVTRWLLLQGFFPLTDRWENGNDPNIPLRISRSGRIYKKRGYKFDFTK